MTKTNPKNGNEIKPEVFPKYLNKNTKTFKSLS